jgi:hypothetical protein
VFWALHGLLDRPTLGTGPLLGQAQNAWDSDESEASVPPPRGSGLAIRFRGSGLVLGVSHQAVRVRGSGLDSVSVPPHRGSGLAVRVRGSG